MFTTRCVCYHRALRCNRISSLIEEGGLTPEILLNYNFDDYDWDNPQDIKVFHKYVKKEIEKPWVYIYGPLGTGKTYLAILIAQFALVQERELFYASVSKFLDILRPGPLYDEKGYLVKEKCLNCDLLILDDIGKERWTDWSKEIIFRILNERYQNKKQTIITSNFDLNELGQLIGEDAIVDRIRHLSTLMECKERKRPY